MQPDTVRQRFVEDRRDDVRGQQGQIDVTCDVAVVGPLAAGDLVHRGGFADFQHPKPAVTASRRQLERRIPRPSCISNPNSQSSGATPLWLCCQVFRPPACIAGGYDMIATQVSHRGASQRSRATPQSCGADQGRQLRSGERAKVLIRR